MSILPKSVNKFRNKKKNSNLRTTNSTNENTNLNNSKVDNSKFAFNQTSNTISLNLPTLTKVIRTEEDFLFKSVRKIQNEDDVYNIELGGIGGWTHLSKDSKSKASKTRWQNMSDLERKQSIDAWKNSCKGRTHTIEERQRMSESLKRFYANNPTRTGMYGKHHTEQTKQKLSQSHTGNKNPSFGKMWICNDKTHQSKTILKTKSIPDGWRKGRFCK